MSQLSRLYEKENEYANQMATAKKSDQATS